MNRLDSLLISGDMIYEFNLNVAKKTNYKSLDEFYLKKYNITHQTIHLNNETIDAKYNRINY